MRTYFGWIIDERHALLVFGVMNVAALISGVVAHYAKIPVWVAIPASLAAVLSAPLWGRAIHIPRLPRVRYSWSLSLSIEGLQEALKTVELSEKARSELMRALAEVGRTSTEVERLSAELELLARRQRLVQQQMVFLLDVQCKDSSATDDEGMQRKRLMELVDALKIELQKAPSG